MSFEDDLRKLQHLYSFVDKKDDAAIARWFDSTDHLGSITQAQIANMSICVLRDMRRRVIGPKTPYRNLKPSTAINVPSIEIPVDWDTKEWLEKAYALYGTVSISKAVKVSRNKIYQCLKKHGIAIQPRKPKNVYCNKQWIIEHYINQKLSMNKCAALTGVSIEIFSSWLIKFKIPYRSPYDRAYQESPKLWLTQLIQSLKQYPIVKDVKYVAGVMNVYYKHGLYDKFYLNMPKVTGYEMTDNDNNIKNIPKIRQEYEGSLIGNEYSIHVEISKQQWKKANIIEQRLATHNLVEFYLSHGWTDPKYPQHALDQELVSLRMVPVEKLVKKNVFTLIPNAYSMPSYYRIIEHYFDMSHIADLFKSPKELMEAIRLAHHRKTSINSSLVIKYLLMARKLSKEQKMRWTHPAIFATIFQKMQLAGKSILDLNPYHGFKAIACSFLGIKYYTLPNTTFDVGLKNGFGEFLQLDHEYYKGQEVDLIMSDNDFKKTADFNYAFKFASRTKNILLYVTNQDHEEFHETYKPQSVIPLRIKIYDTTPEHLFVF